MLAASIDYEGSTHSDPPLRPRSHRIKGDDLPRIATTRNHRAKGPPEKFHFIPRCPGTGRSSALGLWTFARANFASRLVNLPPDDGPIPHAAPSELIQAKSEKRERERLVESKEREKKNGGGGETWNTKKMESTSLGICSGNEHGLTKERDEHKGTLSSGGQCATTTLSYPADPKRMLRSLYKKPVKAPLKNSTCPRSQR
ncbi:hypothetical protein Q8A67_019668 [Cirrhinus molitorella]|uniref:Uncharacterized protein n=1 Tax=Cirrhinus molitorella TaxID=172907 RepID=A0AA88TI64_9TELE|nr:hypothetical protein Q8A67_019668 [Cirrhinus molitorella]